MKSTICKWDQKSKMNVLQWIRAWYTASTSPVRLGRSSSIHLPIDHWHLTNPITNFPISVFCCMHNLLCPSTHLLLTFFCSLWPHCSCQNALVTFNTAPALPNGTGSPVYPAMLFLCKWLQKCKSVIGLLHIFKLIHFGNSHELSVPLAMHLILEWAIEWQLLLMVKWIHYSSVSFVVQSGVFRNCFFHSNWNPFYYRKNKIMK